MRYFVRAIGFALLRGLTPRHLDVLAGRTPRQAPACPVRRHLVDARAHVCTGEDQEARGASDASSFANCRSSSAVKDLSMLMASSR